MDRLKNKSFKLLETITNLVILNILWIISCIPVITIFPATTAMFSVVRNWQTNKDPTVLKQYMKEFIANFKNSFFIGLIWLVMIFVLYFDFAFVLTLETHFKVIGFGVFFTISFLIICTTVFLFPILVNYQVNWKQAIFNSFVASMVYFPTTLSIIIFMIITIVLTYFIPPLSLIFFSLNAYINYAFCNEKFNTINSIKGFKKTSNNNQK